MRAIMRGIVLAVGLFCALMGAGVASAQGTIPLALQQYVDINGKPLIGCQLFIYQAGTVSTLQQPWQDFGLTNPASNPLQCDIYGRIPMFWLANGLIHARLLDAGGVQVVDVTMQVLGPSSGSGGGGSTVDPTTIAATGDIKFRMTAETVTGWVKLNGLTIGSATSGATGRANSDTQNLFIYLWTNCTNAHCAVPGGRGVSALADFNANKQITLPAWQDKAPIGRDCMDASCAGVLLSSNVSSGGGDGVDTPAAFGGGANWNLLQANIPNYPLPVTDPGHFHLFNTYAGTASAAPGVTGGNSYVSPAQGGATTTSTTGITVASGGSGTAFGLMDPFVLGTWYVKL